MPRPTDAVLRHARREALVIFAAWTSCAIYCCSYSYFFGYIRPDRPLGPGDVRPTFGMPSWVFWGVMVPWVVAAAFTLAFVAFGMADDDLGADHAAELEAEIREGATDE